jgi:hypothetical protein
LKYFNGCIQTQPSFSSSYNAAYILYLTGLSILTFLPYQSQYLPFNIGQWWILEEYIFTAFLNKAESITSHHSIATKLTQLMIWYLHCIYRFSRLLRLHLPFQRWSAYWGLIELALIQQGFFVFAKRSCLSEYLMPI